jgi:hypothetical protein
MTYAKEPEYSLLTFQFSGTAVRYRRLNGVANADRTSGMASLSVVTWTVKSLSPSGLSVFGPAACLGIFRSWESSMVVTVRVCPKPKTNGLWIASRNDRATRGRPLIAAHGCRWRNEVREDQLSLANATRFGGAQANSSRNPTQTTTRISSIAAAAGRASDSSVAFRPSVDGDGARRSGGRRRAKTLSTPEGRYT